MNILPVVSLTAAVLLTAACSCPSGNRPEKAVPAPLETSTKASIVQTVSGPVAGYIDDGVYIYKGIPFKALLYGLYVVIAIAGYYKWKSQAKTIKRDQ